MAGKKLTEKQIGRLVAKGKTLLIKGFKSKAGRPFEAYLKLDPNFKTTFEFPDRGKSKAPARRPNR